MPLSSPSPSTKLETIVADQHHLLHPDESVQAAAEKMEESNVNTMPVSQGRHLVGMLEEPHPDRCAAGFGHDPKKAKVGAAMSPTINFCYEDEDCAEALRKMNERQVDRLPVVDREMRIVGILNRSDLGERDLSSEAQAIEGFRS